MSLSYILTCFPCSSYFICQLIAYLIIRFQIIHKRGYASKSGKSCFLNIMSCVCLSASVVIKNIVFRNLGILQRQHERHQFRVLSADALRPPSIGSYNSIPELNRPERLYPNTMLIYTQHHCTLQRGYANTEHI